MNDNKKTCMAGSHDVEQNTKETLHSYLFIKITYIFLQFFGISTSFFTLECFLAQTGVVHKVKPLLSPKWVVQRDCRRLPPAQIPLKH